MNEKEVKKYFALGFIIILFLFLAYALGKYISAIFGALIFYYLFNWLFKFLKNKLKINKHIAAIVIIIVTLLIIIIPTYLFLNTAFTEVGNLYENRGSIIDGVKKINELVPEYDLSNIISQQLTNFGNWLQSIIIQSFASITHIIISLIIMYFILYYLYVNSDKVENGLIWLIPFNKKNSKRLINKFKNVTYSTVITSGLIAVMQGLLISIGFIMFGLRGALLWGLIGAIISFLPVLGTALIWGPAAIILLIQHQPMFAIGMFIWGIFLSNIDNVIRPQLQNKIGKIHPLITLLGIFIGIPFFGLLGIIIGPLLLSYLLLSVNMFREEYFDHDEKIDIYTPQKKKKHIIKKITKTFTKKKKI